MSSIEEWNLTEGTKWIEEWNLTAGMILTFDSRFGGCCSFDRIHLHKKGTFEQVPFLIALIYIISSMLYRPLDLFTMNFAAFRAP